MLFILLAARLDHVFTAERTLKPQAGWEIISLVCVSCSNANSTDLLGNCGFFLGPSSE